MIEAYSFQGELEIVIIFTFKVDIPIIQSKHNILMGDGSFFSRQSEE